MIIALDAATTKWLVETLESLDCLQNYHVESNPEAANAKRHLVEHHGFQWLRSMFDLSDRQEVARWTTTGKGEHVRISVWYEEGWRVELYKSVGGG